jgi:predicted nucleotidyltransferase
MKNAVINRGIIRKIALALGKLNEQVIYVGGATVGLYINDLAAEDVRPTKDVDISLSIATLGELEKIREELFYKGFIQTSEDNIICRFRYDDVKVDFMNTKAIGWAPANTWFAPGFENRLPLEIEDQQIYIIPLPYFLATKFAAYNSRGNNEPRSSHDFEDIVYVLDNRTDLIEQILRANDDVKPYLKKEFGSMLNEKVKQEAILGNLNYESRNGRFIMIMNKLIQIVNEL